MRQFDSRDLRRFSPPAAASTPNPGAPPLPAQRSPLQRSIDQLSVVPVNKYIDCNPGVPTPQVMSAVPNHIEATKTLEKCLVGLALIGPLLTMGLADQTFRASLFTEFRPTAGYVGLAVVAARISWRALNALKMASASMSTMKQTMETKKYEPTVLDYLSSLTKGVNMATFRPILPAISAIAAKVLEKCAVADQNLFQASFFRFCTFTTLALAGSLLVSNLIKFRPFSLVKQNTGRESSKPL